MTWNEKLQAIIDYIEDRLQNKEEPIQQAYIAQIAQCSYTFFQKVFSYTTGISFAEYIRYRKMTLAGYDIKQHNLKVIDLSMIYGYDSPTSFTKAFRMFHGVTPKEARHAEVELRVYPKMQILYTHNHFKWRIEKKPSLHFIGKTFKIEKHEDMSARIPEIWSMCQQDGVFPLLSSLDQAKVKGILGCFLTDKEASVNTYQVMVEHNINVVGFDEYELPPCSWAIFDCIGPLPTSIQDGWNYLYHEWAQQYPFQHANCPEIEWYSSGNIYDKNYLSQIWIPIIEEEL